jgi:hypothetical protein
MGWPGSTRAVPRLRQTGPTFPSLMRGQTAHEGGLGAIHKGKFEPAWEPPLEVGHASRTILVKANWQELRSGVLGLAHRARPPCCGAPPGSAWQMARPPPLSRDMTSGVPKCSQGAHRRRALSACSGDPRWRRHKAGVAIIAIRHAHSSTRKSVAKINRAPALTTMSPGPILATTKGSTDSWR